MENQSPNSRKENIFNLHIPSENLIEYDNFISEFTCMICLGIVIKPLQLKCCDHLICFECLKLYIRSSCSAPRCPLCKHSLIYTNPSKILMRLYSSLKIKCISCAITLKQEGYFDHVFNQCNNKENKDHNFCKKCCEVYETLETGKEHKCPLLIETKEPKLHEHNLKYTNLRKHFNYEKLGWLCDFCESCKYPDDKSYHCKKCGLDVCDECISFIKGKSETKSLHFHELRLGKAVDWVCSQCKKDKKFSYAWSCAACDLDVCLKCYWK